MIQVDLKLAIVKIGSEHRSGYLSSQHDEPQERCKHEPPSFLQVSSNPAHRYTRIRGTLEGCRTGKGFQFFHKVKSLIQVIAATLGADHIIKPFGRFGAKRWRLKC